MVLTPPHKANGPYFVSNTAPPARPLFSARFPEFQNFPGVMVGRRAMDHGAGQRHEAAIEFDRPLSTR